MQRKFLSGGGISQIYPPPEGAVDSRVRTDHRDHRPGGADRGTVGLVGDHKPVQHGGGDARQRNLKGELGVGRHGGGNGSLTDADIVDPVHGIAFAVYSEDDHSLMFYKRRGVPRVGDMLNSRRVTAVYTGFENGYATATVGNDGKTTAPWWPNRSNIVAVKAIDDGIEINSLAFCFQYMENYKSFDLAKVRHVELHKSAARIRVLRQCDFLQYFKLGYVLGRRIRLGAQKPLQGRGD